MLKSLLKLNAGIDFWINNPAKTAKIIAEELSLDLEDATRMMKGTKWFLVKNS